MAGYARFEGGGLTMDGLVGRPDGSELISDRASGSVDDAVEVGVRLAEGLLARGAEAILAASPEVGP